MNKRQILFALFALTGVILFCLQVFIGNYLEENTDIYLPYLFFASLGLYLLIFSILFPIGDPFRRDRGQWTKVFFVLVWVEVFIASVSLGLYLLGDKTPPLDSAVGYPPVGLLFIGMFIVLLPSVLGTALVGYLIEKFYYQRKKNIPSA